MNRNFFWPEISDLPGAVKASDRGFVAAVWVAASTALVATIALLLKSHFLGITAWAYIDVVIFGIVAWRIKRRSPFFAVAGLVLFVIEKILQFTHPQGTGAGIFLAIVILFCFINGVRGTIAYRRFSREEALEPLSHNV